MRRLTRRGRARIRHRFIDLRTGAFDPSALAEAVAAPSMLFPDSDVHRWVPIGPSVVRRGQAGGRPRVSGRVRDLEISDDGKRIYAASAMGGVWYSGNGGSTWEPVGGWADRSARSGGANNAQSCGALLVDFGDDADEDFVLVGTGEPTPGLSRIGEGAFGGLGVLAAAHPATAPVGANPWEDEAGIGVLEGKGIYRLVRKPGTTAGKSTDADADQVFAATTDGLYLGARTHVGPVAPGGHDEYQWSKLGAVDLLVFGPTGPAAGQSTPEVTDVVWLPGNVVVIAIDALGIAVSDNDGATFSWVVSCNNPGSATGIQGRSSLAMAPGSNRLYVLTGLPQTAGSAQPDTPALFRVEDITLAPTAAQPVAQRVGGVHLETWGAQGDYDQALAVDVVDGNDRVFIGGSTIEPRDGDGWAASLWCYDVAAAPAGPPAPATPFVLRAAPGVSRTGPPAEPPPPTEPAGAGEGANRTGLIGNNVHADVHRVVPVTVAGDRHVWVGCDGGVYHSSQAGRVNSFASRCTGLAVLQPTFVAAHPTSHHFVASGFQDNGTQVRSGDTMWEMTFEGDGGGTVFHPRLGQYVVTQWTCGTWMSQPQWGFVGPISRWAGGAVASGDREDQQGISDFYSGTSMIPTGTGNAARLALGTSRVWVSDNVGTTGTNAWRVLPYPNGAATDPRFANGTERPGQSYRGVPTDAALGPLVAAPWVGVTGQVGPMRGVVTAKWESPTSLVVLFSRGVVRWVEDPPGQWTATVLLSPATVPAGTVLTDIGLVPGGTDFYLTTTGDPTNTGIDTCYLWDDAGAALVGAGLRSAMNPASPPAPAGTIGPLDPAYAVVVDPANPREVYVGTVTGVWKGQRDAAPSTNHTWPAPPFVNGLPQAAVQDLSIWHDPADATAPRMLRAGIQARGVWEVDLAAAEEPSRTYLRVHPRDDRRRFPTPMANPRRASTATAETLFESPDITVRPRQDPPSAPAYGGQVISARNVLSYQLWTFQTAFRWRYPSVVPTGLWTDAFGDLVQLERARLRLPPGRYINGALWNAVVGGSRLGPDLSLSDVGGHPLAVYRPSWQTPLDPDARATEVDLLETVQPRSVTGGRWLVFSEPSTVDVLLHHRDSRPIPAGSAYAMLLWRTDSSQTTLLSTPAAGIVDWARAAVAGGNPAPPAGWQVGGARRNPLSVPLQARMPRAVPIDVDLTGLARFTRVLLLAIAGSSVDECSAAPVAMPAGATVSDLVQRWPYAAMRLVTVSPR